MGEWIDLMEREEGRNCLNLTRSKREAGGYVGPPITVLEIRVGLVTKAWSHEELEKEFNKNRSTTAQDLFMDETAVAGWSPFAWVRFASAAAAVCYSCIPGKDKGTWASSISSLRYK